MEDTISNPSMEPLFFSVDPISLILSQNSDTHHQLKLLLDGFSGYERGPRYDEYSRLRESKLQLKRDFHKYLQQEEEPRKKQVRFEGNSVISQKKQSRVGFSSVVAQSVPDFSAVIRKENCRPVNFNNTTTTPPSSKSRNGSVLNGLGSCSSRGSKSASVGEKKSKGMMMGMARKSYATVQDLKKISMAAASAINGGGGGGGRKVDGGGRTILGYRQIY
ncbi:hypothetical protein AALP_AA6G351000 [Arabis alpina]|uniref:Uncharacterized protein n=1 Tax=Arabis alpina TaxID=50452 RepID=A0A087GTQ5_ARAAL|nr:hypothetical protein AALP_AA6G351000 [Arabis alpina]